MVLSELEIRRLESIVGAVARSLCLILPKGMTRATMDRRKSLLRERVRDITLGGGMSASELVEQLRAGGGFVAKKVGLALGILERMQRERCTRFLSFPACIVATGCRGVIKDMLKEKLADVVITTCGALDHDLARAWSDYYHGDFHMDDSELRRLKIHRLGNVLVPSECYGALLEERVQPILEELYLERKEFSTKELAWELGRRAGEGSILHWAWRNGIPVYVPGIFDGALGSQLWLFWQEHRDFKVDLFKDQQELADIVLSARKTGALIVGGGISKHHTLWWNAFRGGLDYAVYLTTAQEYDGSLSGAEPREAVSWGKIKGTAKHVVVEGDATVTLPIIMLALLERLKQPC